MATNENQRSIVMKDSARELKSLEESLAKINLLLRGSDEIVHLRSDIICDDGIGQQMLTVETTYRCNGIFSLGITQEYFGIVVQITDYQAVHVALGLPECPCGLQKGIDPQASFHNFRAWLIASAHALDLYASCRLGDPLSTCWHHLTSQQAHGMAFGHWFNLEWACAIKRGGLASICLVLMMYVDEEGHTHMFEMPTMFG